MIQIIAGTFGYYNGRKVVPITNADGPQKFDPELEARLVKKGRRQVRRREAPWPLPRPQSRSGSPGRHLSPTARLPLPSTTRT